MKIGFRIISLLMIFTLLGTYITPIETTAATKETTKKITNSDYKKAIKSLKNILNPDVNDEEYKKFGFIDFNNDKMPELLVQTDFGIIVYRYNFSEGEYEECRYVVKGNEVSYYNKEKNIIITYVGSDTMKVWKIYDIDISAENTSDIFMDQEKIYLETTNSENNKKEYFYTYFDSIEAYKISKSKFEKQTKDLIKNAEKIKTNIKNTKANRNKYFKDVETFKNTVINANNKNK